VTAGQRFKCYTSVRKDSIPCECFPICDVLFTETKFSFKTNYEYY